MMSATNQTPLIIAHRGASADAPENTRAAFRRALETGADGLEFDVRLAKNGVPVVFHDPTLKRIANRNLRVLNLTSDELAAVDAGSWFNRRHPLKSAALYAAETIPTLQQTLDLLDGYQGLLYIELKCEAGEMPFLVEAVAEMLRQSKNLANIVVKSFELSALAQIKSLLPEIRTAALFAPQIRSLLRRKGELLEKAQEFRADELSLHFSLATQKFVAAARARDLATVIWTADHPIWIARARETGIRAIITNNPARLLATRCALSEENSTAV